MASSETNALKFAKLNGSNYQTWVFNMRLYLESMDLPGNANGSAESPRSSASRNRGETSIRVLRKHGHIFVWRLSPNSKYM